MRALLNGIGLAALLISCGTSTDVDALFGGQGGASGSTGGTGGAVQTGGSSANDAAPTDDASDSASIAEGAVSEAARPPADSGSGGMGGGGTGGTGGGTGGTGGGTGGMSGGASNDSGSVDARPDVAVADARPDVADAFDMGTPVPADASDGSAPAKTIRCGSATCDFATEYCCPEAGNARCFKRTQGQSCPKYVTRLLCDERTDCPASQYCCLAQNAAENRDEATCSATCAGQLLCDRTAPNSCEATYACSGTAAISGYNYCR